MATTYIDDYRHLVAKSGVGTILAGRQVRDVHEEIALLDAGNTALTTLLMKLRTLAATSIKVEWQNDVFPAISAKVNTVLSSGVTDITVDDGTLFRPGDMWFYAEGDEILYVDKVASNVVTFVRGVGDTSPGAMGSGDTLFYLAPGMADGDGAREQLTTQVSQEYNYEETLQEAYGVDTIADTVKLYGGKDMTYLRRKHGEIHKKDMERALMFGERAALTGTDSSNYIDGVGSAAHTMRGVWRWIVTTGSDSYIYTNATLALTEDEFNTALEQIGRYGNRTKFALCAPRALTVISSWGRDKLQVMPKDTTFGINITKYISPTVDLNLVNYPLFYDMADSAATYDPSTSMLILDLEEMWYRPLINTKLLQNRQENDKHAVLEEYYTVSSLEFRQEAHHSMVTGWSLS